MNAKYIFRLDDISEHMDCEKYHRVKSIFIKYDVKPIIGVIPKNKDKQLLIYPKCKFDFWNEVKILQDEKNGVLHSMDTIISMKQIILEF